MNKAISDNFNYFTKNYREIYDAYQEYGKAVHNVEGGLGNPCACIVKVAISVTAGKMFALETHIKKALEVGRTPKEIEHTILLTAPTVGFPTMMEALMVFRRVMESRK